MNEAPYFSDVALGPDPNAVEWLRASDGKRLRGALWRGGSKGTIFIFQGRTEYTEKYGEVADRFLDRGISVVTLDWRGQGLSDRFPGHYQIGEVDDFADYQKDVAEMLSMAERHNLPKPYFALGHSLGGCVLLRALHKGLDVDRVVFSSPMWGIQVPPVLGALSSAIIAVYRGLGLQDRLAPGRKLGNYVEYQPFKGNALTKDKAEYDLLKKQLEAHSDLGLGGPSLNWVDLALRETEALQKLPPPNVLGAVIYAGDEQIVCNKAIRHVAKNWKAFEAIEMPGAEHEVLLEVPKIRKRVWSEIDAALGL